MIRTEENISEIDKRVLIWLFFQRDFAGDALYTYNCNKTTFDSHLYHLENQLTDSKTDSLLKF